MGVPGDIWRQVVPRVDRLGRDLVERVPLTTDLLHQHLVRGQLEFNWGNPEKNGNENGSICRKK